MPYDPSKYSSFSYFWRAACSAVCCMGLATVFTYPLDTIHTRVSADMSKKNQPRLFKTTFDCFNRTHIDEGRLGLFKGAQAAMTSGVLKAALTLPVYDLLRQSNWFSDAQKDSIFGTFWQRLGPAALSATMISLILYPFDTVKRCL